MPNDSDHIIFSSTAFPIVPGEDAHTNPGVFGTSLATWLATELRAKYTVEDEFIPEGFGYLVNVQFPKGSVYVVCTSTDENADEWRVFTLIDGGIFRKLLNRMVSIEERDEVFKFVREKVIAHPGTTAWEDDC
ncbi:MAG: hypothetical protein JNJ45_11865 [Chthonomonas sp.]|nr:hypothetical protein [Chthonomonas sp.]